MFFSTKLLLSVFAVFGLATFASASPVAAPASVVDIAKRQSSDFISELQSFQSTVTPLIAQLSQAAATGADTTSSLNQLSSAFSDSTNSFKSKTPGVIANVDVTIVAGLASDIVVKLVLSLTKFSILNLFVGVKVDIFLSVWLSALDVLHPGIAVVIGKGIPIADIGIFALLKLGLSARVLGIINILGIVN